MRITRIDFEGEAGYYAKAQRRDGMHNGPDIILVTIFTPDTPNGREHHVDADRDDVIRSMAECLQRHLKGCPGANSDATAYYRDLLRLSNLCDVPEQEAKTDETQIFAEAIRDNLSPETVASIAFALAPVHSKNPDVDRQVRWLVGLLLSDVLHSTVGADEMKRIINELGL